MEINLKDLRAQLTTVLAQVKDGEHVTILQRGERIAVIKPYVDYADQRQHIALSAADSLGYLDTLETQKFAQKRRDDILRGVNRKPKS